MLSINITILEFCIPVSHIKARWQDRRVGDGGFSRWVAAGHLTPPPNWLFVWEVIRAQTRGRDKSPVGAQTHSPITGQGHGRAMDKTVDEVKLKALVVELFRIL